MPNNIISQYTAATGTVFAGPNNLCGYQIAPGGTAGSIVFRDGGAGGVVRLTVPITTALTGVAMLMPGEGIRFYTDIHVTLPLAATITTFTG